MKVFQTTILTLSFLFLALFANAQGIEKYIPATPNPPRLVNDFIDVLKPRYFGMFAGDFFGMI